MAVQKIGVEQFVKLSTQYPVIDVRSDGEYTHAHIPGAYSLPLFDNEERKVVGTIYKQQSREQAIKKGLEYFGPKMKDMIVFVEKNIAKHYPENKTVLVHCWRGGMRSAGVAWLLDLYGFKVYTLAGGYKTFRNWVLGQFEKPWKINIVGGYTGSGKTILLEALKTKGETIVDLEGIAGHRGSAFGRIGLPEQPSVEMFENKLALELSKLEIEKTDKPIWIEDESQRIGSVSIPHMLWNTMRNSIVYFLNIPFSERLDYLVDTYGKMDKEELYAATERIQKKLGGLETKIALQHLENNNIAGCFDILLKYYDKLYLKSLNSRIHNLYQHLISKDDIEKQNEHLFKEYKNLYIKEIAAEIVESDINSEKLKEAHYGKN